VTVLRRAILLIVILAAVVYGDTYFAHRAVSATSTTQARTGAANYGIAAGSGLTDDSPAVLNQRLTTMENLGVGWVRFDFDWSKIQPDNAISYDWSATDRVVQAATAHHLKILGTIDYTPTWARAPGCTNSHCQPLNPVSFAAFSGAVAARYAPMGVHDWEIWNEENTVLFWQPTPSPAAYTLMLKSTYLAIKNAAPSAFILTGGLAETATTHGDIDPVDYLVSLYAFGARGSFDAVASHPYTYPALPSASDSQGPFALHQVMVSHSDSSKPIWITEIGAPTNGPPGHYVSNNVQADTVTAAAKVYNEPWIGPLFWYNDTDTGTSLVTNESFFGLVQANGTHKPAYNALQAIISEKH
jgi:polysaccharide biosynthesis protein PslG